MDRTGILDEVRYTDRFLRDLARRLNFVAALAMTCREPAGFLDDVKSALEEGPDGRARVPAR